MKHRRKIAVAIAIAIAMLLRQAPMPASATRSSGRLILPLRLVPPDGRPERYFCAIASQRLDFNDFDYPPAGAMTDTGMRCGFAQIYRARLIDQTSLRLQPGLPADSAHVLTIDPLFTLRARSGAAKSIRGIVPTSARNRH